MATSPLFASASRVIPASRQEIFDLLCNPLKHPLIDGSGSVRQARPGGPARLSLGAKFGMDMHLGGNYKIENTVVEFDEPGLIGWRHFNGHIWRYRLSEVAGGTQVTEVGRPNRKNRPFLVLTRFSKRNHRGITATLEKLDLLARAPGQAGLHGSA